MTVGKPRGAWGLQWETRSSNDRVGVGGTGGGSPPRARRWWRAPRPLAPSDGSQREVPAPRRPSVYLVQGCEPLPQPGPSEPSGFRDFAPGVRPGGRQPGEVGLLHCHLHPSLGQFRFSRPQGCKARAWDSRELTRSRRNTGPHVSTASCPRSRAADVHTRGLGGNPRRSPGAAALLGSAVWAGPLRPGARRPSRLLGSSWEARGRG